MIAFKEPLPWQALSLSMPEMIDGEPLDLSYPGSRGGGKTLNMLVHAIAHILRAAAGGYPAHILFTRKSYPALRDVISKSQALIPQFFPLATFNKQDSVWTVGGATLTFGHLTDWASVQRIQGFEFSLICADECQALPTPEYLDLITACLRLYPGRLITSFNAGDKGQNWLAERYYKPSLVNPLFRTNHGRLTFVMPSTMADNKHLPANYADVIRSATKGNKTLQHQWLTGDLTAIGGMFFSDYITQENRVNWPLSDMPRDFPYWEAAIGIDWGSASPASIVLGFRAKQNTTGPDGKFYPMGSMVIAQEVDTSDPDDRTKGTYATVAEVSKQTHAMWQDWKLKGDPRGWGDAAMFADLGTESIGQEFRSNQIFIQPSKKGARGPQWTLVREKLSNAAGCELPGLFVDNRCTYGWICMESSPAKVGTTDDMENTFGHFPDAVRYLLLRPTTTMKTETLYM
jgi:hypothetical protein